MNEILTYENLLAENIELRRRMSTLTQDAVTAHERVLREIVDPKIDALQARIDELMIEYCPNEMTPEQMANYENHQVVVAEHQVPILFTQGETTRAIKAEEELPKCATPIV